METFDWAQSTYTSGTTNRHRPTTPLLAKPDNREILWQTMCQKHSISREADFSQGVWTQKWNYVGNVNCSSTLEIGMRRLNVYWPAHPYSLEAVYSCSVKAIAKTKNADSHRVTWETSCAKIDWLLWLATKLKTYSICTQEKPPEVRLCWRSARSQNIVELSIWIECEFDVKGTNVWWTCNDLALVPYAGRTTWSPSACNCLVPSICYRRWKLWCAHCTYQSQRSEQSLKPGRSLPSWRLPPYLESSKLIKNRYGLNWPQWHIEGHRHPHLPLQ
jgi:hypothetical protein